MTRSPRSLWRLFTPIGWKIKCRSERPSNRPVRPSNPNTHNPTTGERSSLSGGKYILLYFTENQYFENYFLKSGLPFWVIPLSRCKPLKFQKMKKLIFSTIAIGILAITSTVLSSDVNRRAQDASFSNQSEESSACKHGQCHATAASTGYRCLHCVSNAGNSYCWQHK